MPYDLDQCFFICEEGPGFVFSFSNMSQADTFFKYNNDKLLEKWNEKAKNTKYKLFF